MSDYISRADAIEAVRKELVCDGRHEEHDKVCRFIADVILSALPSADAVNREIHVGIVNELTKRIEELKADAVHGEWIIRENGNKECSLCGHERQDGWDYFCGYCGAKMKGGAE